MTPNAKHVRKLRGISWEDRTIFCPYAMLESILSSLEGVLCTSPASQPKLMRQVSGEITISPIIFGNEKY